MSITVRKVRVTTSEINEYIARGKVLKRLATYIATLPGCSITHPLVTLGNRFYVNMNVSGGDKDQLSFVGRGNDNSPYFYIGLCDNGFEPDLTSASAGDIKCSFYEQLMHERVTDYHDYYFIIQDGKVICFSDAVGCYMVYKHEGSLKTFIQKQAIIPNFYNNGNDYSVQISGLRVDFQGNSIFEHSETGICKQIGGCKEEFSRVAITFHLPANKMLKFSKIACDLSTAADYNVEDYPINMTGDILMITHSPYYGQESVGATYKKIQVDGKNYIHIGGAAWMPYDSITETTISAD